MNPNTFNGQVLGPRIPLPTMENDSPKLILHTTVKKTVV